MSSNGTLVAQSTVDLKPHDVGGLLITQITSSTVAGEVVANRIASQAPAFTVHYHGETSFPGPLWSV